ncbi:hypothetical protein BRADI_3g05181v3 [Brachypodium distachyon]|uniref:Sulfotransferase n=1 Tax=Brachypodium distachyon TaxID=15368 RepID=A0A0Q3HJJ8_BRADI|nr:hypothetical protein BRADI_3g05181v3 [Brachypodium distachyon]
MASPQAHLGAGPVAFKDVFVDGHDAPPLPLPEGHVYVDVEALPSSNRAHGLRLYRGVWMAENWIRGIAHIRSGGLTARPGDVVLASPPKCGTTWLKALAFATMARAAHPPAGAGDHGKHPLLWHSPHDCVPFIETFFGAGWGNKLDALPSPRLMATHMSKSQGNNHSNSSLMIRDPKDMVVSMWHFIRKIQPHVSFSDVFEHACEGKSLCGLIWDHILGYEELLRETAGNVRKLAQFLGQPFSVSEEESGMAEAIVELCSLDKLSSLEVTNQTAPYFRKGGAGDWTNHMTPQMAHRFDDVMWDKLHGSGLAFT